MVLRRQTHVEEFIGERRVDGVRLRGGDILAADVVVVGIGAIPNTSWLDDSGLAVNVEGNLSTDKFVATFTSEDRLTGAVSFGNPRALAQYRRQMLTSSPT
jgi:NAD(P)H-nitrite reductase large subunit